MFMRALSRAGRVAAALLTLSAAACAPPVMHLTADQMERFRLPPDQAKVYMFMDFSGSMFGSKGLGTEHMRAFVDGEFVGEINGSEYLEIDVTPGSHEFSGDFTGLMAQWTPRPITNHILGGHPSYVALLRYKDRVEFSKANPDVGMTGVLTRQRKGDAFDLAGGKNGPSSSPVPDLTAMPAASPTAAQAPASRGGADPLAALHYPPAAPRPDDVAVIIGNSAYDRGSHDIPAVPPAHNDALAMRRYVVDGLGVRDGNVIFLENATSAQMTEVFGNERDPHGRLFDWVKPGRSRVFVYYAGHGAPSGQGHRPMLVPVDATAAQIGLSGYPLDVLYANLAKLPADSVTVVIEACFSGISEAGSLIPKASPIAIVPKSVSVPGKLTVITAGAADQIASWEQDRSHGLFTEYYLRGLAGEADQPPNGDGDGAVTADELARYLKENVTYLARRYYSRDQTVQIVRPN